MTYDLTCFQNLTGPSNYLTCVNTVGSGVPGIVLLAGIWFIAFKMSSSRGLSDENGFVVASFVTTIIAALFFFAGIIAWTYAVIPLIMTFFGFILANFSK